MHTAELDSAVIVTSSRPARSLTSRRFAHCGARLCGGMHKHITKLSCLRNFVSCDSPVWCTPWNSDSAWNFWRYFVFLTLLGDAQCTHQKWPLQSLSTEGCTTLWSFLNNLIYTQNRKSIQKYFCLLIRGPDGLESLKWSRFPWHTPFKNGLKELCKLFSVSICLELVL